MAGFERALAYHEAHAPRLAAAAKACRTREFWSAYPDLPSKYPDWQAAEARGRAWLAAAHGAQFSFDLTGPELQPLHAHDGAQVHAAASEEVSPYTQLALGVHYPVADIDAAFAACAAAMPAWAAAPLEARLGVLLEACERIYLRVFDVVAAVMHTAGQSFNMAFAGSGVNALDRALEALSHAESALRAVPTAARWEREFGKERVILDKRYQCVPRGVAVCFACASFPTWNAWPSLLASLATGNAVLLKPHPAAVLPMALTVRVLREVLAECGFDPQLAGMLVDTQSAPIGKLLVAHPRAAIVDFTGSAAFGAWVEAHAGKRPCYTETSGVNTVVLESCVDLDAVLRSLATTMSLFSAQMCTSPQNIYIAEAGVWVGAAGAQTRVPASIVEERLVAAIDALFAEPRRASMIAAAIQASHTLTQLAELEARARGCARVLRASAPYTHPEFPAARTATPLVIGATQAVRELYAEERFGPVAFVIRVENAELALAAACDDVRAAGGITAFVYSCDADFVTRAEQAYASCGAQLTVNLTGAMPLNFAASYSDYHVSGLNPAGTATLTDAAFIAGRFRITQVRTQVSAS